MLINKMKISDLSTLDGYVNIPLSLNYSPETQQYENMEDNLDLTTSDIINDIVDYEKVKLYPAILKNGEIIEVNALYLGFHFYLNGNWDEDPTKISDIGFTESDVKYRRKRLEKSFARLSFYDSKDFKTQNLLYYSTIFVDSNRLYNEYITDGSITNLEMTFLAEDPKLSNKAKSFEGYNLYLYKDDVSKIEEKTIYCRIDFSNALDGKTVLFTRKLSETLIPSGYTMEELYNRLFFEINCKFDEAENKYIAYFNLDEETQNKSGLLEMTSNIDDNDSNIKNALYINAYQAKVK
jgi:hypothetical protein